MVRMGKLPKGIHEKIQPLVERIATMEDVVAFISSAVLHEMTYNH